jgi:hypothetical protein
MLPAIHRRAALLATAALIVATALAACTTTPTPEPTPTASPSPGPDPLVVYRTIAEQVAAIRQLDAPERTDPKIIDPEELRTNLEAEFEKSNPPAQVQLSERVLIGLGLLPKGSSLADLVNELQGSQVIGYYDPSVKELFIVSRTGSLGPTERTTYAHEFTHELQDDHFDLESLGLDQSFNEGDRGLAILGLVEGDAVSAQTAWMAQNLNPAELAQIAAEAADPAILDVLARTPRILLETSLFPYQQGASFVQTLIAQGGYAKVDAAYKDPPASTEQVLHPEKFLEGEAPVDVELPADIVARLGTGWTLDTQDTLGELQLRVWLVQGGLAGDVARTATEGWGGDRLGLFHGPAGQDVLLLSTAWDTLDDAVAFQAAAKDLPVVANVAQNGQRVAVVIGDPGLGRLELSGLMNALLGVGGGIEG